MSDHVHASHPAIVKRLNRAGGHLRSIVEMIEAGRSCADIAQQLHAVERAVSSAKRALIEDHIDHCLTNAGDPGEAGVVECQSALKFDPLSASNIDPLGGEQARRCVALT